MRPEIQSLHGRMAQGGDWFAFRKEIASLHEQAQTEEEFVTLLEAHKNLVAVAKECFDEATYTKLLAAATAEYRYFLIKESTEDGLVNPVLLEKVTRREVSAGRLAPDDSMRTTATSGAAVLGDSANITAHKFRPGNWFFLGMASAGVLAAAFQQAQISVLWLIALGLALGWLFNERERKAVEKSIAARRN